MIFLIMNQLWRFFPQPFFPQKRMWLFLLESCSNKIFFSFLSGRFWFDAVIFYDWRIFVKTRVSSQNAFHNFQSRQKLFETPKTKNLTLFMQKLSQRVHRHFIYFLKNFQKKVQICEVSQLFEKSFEVLIKNSSKILKSSNEYFFGKEQKIFKKYFHKLLNFNFRLWEEWKFLFL